MTVKHRNEETHMLRKTGRRLAVARCPLYEQVRNVLVERLRHGDWHPGDRLPTESVLAEELGVSLGTLRRAVELLVEEGALIRRQGAGTFAATLATVAEENRFQPFESLDGSTRFDFRRLVLLEEAPCPAEAAAGLGIRAGDTGIHMVRHMVKRTPEGERIAASDEIFLLPEFFPGLTAERYRRGYRPDDSIYRFYAREMGVVITSQRCAVRYECEGERGRAARRSRSDARAEVCAHLDGLRAPARRIPHLQARCGEFADLLRAAVGRHVSEGGNGKRPGRHTGDRAVSQCRRSVRGGALRGLALKLFLRLRGLRRGRARFF